MKSIRQQVNRTQGKPLTPAYRILPATSPDMLELVSRLPEQLSDAWKIAETQLRQQSADGRQPSAVSNIIVCGMGGSGIGGDLLAGLLLYSSPLPVLTVKDYELPGAAGRSSLFLVVSYSGNTEETIAGYRQICGIRDEGPGTKRQDCGWTAPAKDSTGGRGRRPPCIVVTSGGILAELARKKGDTVVTVPTGYPPRAAVAYLFAPLLVALRQLRLAPDLRPELDETVRVLAQDRSRLRAKARTLARELGSRLPIIYSTSRLLDPVAQRWRCQLNENAKVLAHVNSFPELDHNEIVGVGGPRGLARLCHLLVLSDPNAHRRNHLRVRLTLEILKTQYHTARIIRPQGRSQLARAFSLIMLGDLVSCYLARQRRVDPMPVQRIDQLKQRMARG